MNFRFLHFPSSMALQNPISVQRTRMLIWWHISQFLVYLWQIDLIIRIIRFDNQSFNFPVRLITIYPWLSQRCLWSLNLTRIGRITDISALGFYVILAPKNLPISSLPDSDDFSGPLLLSPRLFKPIVTRYVINDIAILVFQLGLLSLSFTLLLWDLKRLTLKLCSWFSLSLFLICLLVRLPINLACFGGGHYLMQSHLVAWSSYGTLLLQSHKGLNGFIWWMVWALI